MSHSILVGNIGEIQAQSHAEAKRVFREYVAQSKSGCGRASGEPVTLLENGNPIREYFPSLPFPTLLELTKAVRAYAQELATYNPQDLDDDEGNPSGDIRLQVSDDGWAVHTGDSSYDQDHRGFWGASSVEPNQSDCRSIARDLLEQAKDDYACR